MKCSFFINLVWLEDLQRGAAKRNCLIDLFEYINLGGILYRIENNRWRNVE